MNERPEQPPEGKLIAAATERSGLSIREASRRAGISYGRWRQIASGVQHVSPGNLAAVHAPARTLAKMAAVVGVTPEQMEAEGQRPDAADILRHQRDSRAGAPGHAAPDEPRRRSFDPRPDGLEDYIQAVREDLAAAMIKHGPAFTPEQAFPETHEQATWDDPDGLMSQDERIRLIAWMRKKADEMQGRQRRISLSRA